MYTYSLYRFNAEMLTTKHPDWSKNSLVVSAWTTPTPDHGMQKSNIDIRSLWESGHLNPILADV